MSVSELEEYEEALANRSLMDTKADSEDEDVEDEKLFLSLSKGLSPSVSTRLLRSTVRSSTVISMGDDEVCPLGNKLRMAVDEFCQANGANARVLKDLAAPIGCEERLVLEKVTALHQQVPLLQIKMEKAQKDASELRVRMKEQTNSATLEKLTTRMEALQWEILKLQFSDADRLKLSALESEGWKHSGKDLTKVGVAVKNMKGLLSKTYQDFCQLLIEVNNRLASVEPSTLTSDTVLTGVLTDPEQAAVSSTFMSSTQYQKMQLYLETLADLFAVPLDFWQFVKLQKATLVYELDILNFNPQQGFSLEDITRLWNRNNNQSKEYLAFALVSGDLKVRNTVKIISTLGNVIAWATKFMLRYMEELTATRSATSCVLKEVDHSDPASWSVISLDPHFTLNRIDLKRRNLLNRESAEMIREFQRKLGTLADGTISDVMGVTQRPCSIEIAQIHRAIAVSSQVNEALQNNLELQFDLDLRRSCFPSEMTTEDRRFVTHLLQQDCLFKPSAIPVLPTPSSFANKHTTWSTNSTPLSDIVPTLLDPTVDSLPEVCDHQTDLSTVPIAFSVTDTPDQKKRSAEEFSDSDCKRLKVEPLTKAE